MDTNTSADKKNFKENKENSNNIVTKPNAFKNQNRFKNRYNNNKNKPPQAQKQTQAHAQPKPNKPPFSKAQAQAQSQPQQKKENINKNKKNRYDKQEKYENKKDFRKNREPQNIDVDAQADININANIDIDESVEEIITPVIAEPVEIGPTMEIVGVRYKPVGKIYFFSPTSEQYSTSDKVMVETTKGLELGFVAIPNKFISESKIVHPLKPVLRKATEEDVAKSEKNKIIAKETMKIANDRIKFHNLDNMKMKLIEAEYTFDNSKLIYYFTADGRVDFRDLVKDLATIFKTRIEMRQIGVRDQTKIIGGLSICGRPFCCNSFLQDFAQATIKMAKDQNMSINSAKISGACGRLMCCLKYEHETYDYLSKDTPKVQSIVETSTGESGVVVESNILTGICKVRVNPKSSADNENPVRPFPKKNLKIIGYVKNDQEHLYNQEQN